MVFALGLAGTMLGSYLAGFSEGLKKQRDDEAAKSFVRIALILLAMGIGAVAIGIGQL